MVEQDEDKNHQIEHLENQIEDLADQQRHIVELLTAIQVQLQELSIDNRRQQQEDVVFAERVASPANSSVNSGRERATERGFEIGDRVTILNPKQNQPSEGNITRLTTFYVFITSDSGETVKRTRKNVRRVL